MAARNFLGGRLSVCRSRYGVWELSKFPDGCWLWLTPWFEIAWRAGTHV